MDDRALRSRLAGATAILVAALLPAVAHADPEPFLDVRAGAHAASAQAAPQRVAADRAVREARADLERELGDWGVLAIDPVTGTARNVQRSTARSPAPRPSRRPQGRAPTSSATPPRSGSTAPTSTRSCRCARGARRAA
jgi:hypothetical protein